MQDRNMPQPLDSFLQRFVRRYCAESIGSTFIPKKYSRFNTFENRDGLRKKAGVDDRVPALIKPGRSSEEFRQTWTRYIQKIYNATPLKVKQR